jgi:putative ABC transport system permease protein
MVGLADSTHPTKTANPSRMTLSTFSFREVRSRPGRAILTVLSIVIGVAAVVSVSLATRTTRRAHEEMYKTFSGRATLEVVTVSSAAYEESFVTKLRDLPGVAAAVPTVHKPTRITVHDEGLKVQVLGIDPAVDEKARDYELVEGRFFDGEKGALINAEMAKRLQLSVGDQIKIPNHRFRQIPIPIVGLLAPKGAAAFTNEAVFLHIKTAQSLFNIPRKVHNTHLVLAENADHAQVESAVNAILPQGFLVREPAQRPHMTEETLLATRQGLNLASALSLVVAMFIIVNAFLMNVSERRRQLAIMRAVGATRRQIMRMLLTEGLALGTIGTAIGIALGVFGAYWLTRAMEQLFQSSLPGLEITPLPFVLGVVFGFGVSLVATYLPARKAGLISPLEGMAPVSVEDFQSVPKWETITGAVLLLASAVLLVACIAGTLPLDFGIVAAIGGLIGCVLLIPAALEPASRRIARLFYGLLGVEGALAQRQLVRRRTRTALTIAVLFVAISTGIALGTTILNNTDDVRNWFDRTVVGDFFVRAMMPDMATGLATEVPESLRDEIDQIDGVKEITSVRLVSARIAKQSVILVVKDFSIGERLSLDLKVGEATHVRDRLLAGDVVLGTVLAQRVGLTAGDDVTLETDQGPKTFRVAGLTNEYLVGGLALYMDRKPARELLNVDGADVFIVKAEPERIAAVEAELDELCKRHGLLLQSLGTLRRIVDRMMAGVVGGLWVLLALGLVVAAFGIANTLTMNVLEQTRELGLLRVVAMTRRQVRRTILSQAVIMGLIGLVPGVVMGSSLAYLINLTTQPEFGHTIDFMLRPAMVAICFTAACLIVIATAWLPAERAARLQLITALQYE